MLKYEITTFDFIKTIHLSFFLKGKEEAIENDLINDVIIGSSLYNKNFNIMQFEEYSNYISAQKNNRIYQNIM